MLVDKNSRFRNRQVVLEKKTFFGQLQNIFLLRPRHNSAALRLQSSGRPLFLQLFKTVQTQSNIIISIFIIIHRMDD